MRRIAVVIGILLVSSVAFSEQVSNTSLAEGKKIFVEPAEKEADVAMLKQLHEWGRWKIVGDQAEADLLVRLRVSGNAAWGVGRVQAFILDAKTKETLWTSESRKGVRSVFHGYASPFTRSISGIVKQMKQEIK